MSFDDDADEDAPGFRQPPHPDDRLWRHPSEMASHPVSPIGAFSRRPPADRHPWRAVAAASAFSIVTVAAGLATLLSGTGRGPAEDPAEVRSTGSAPDAASVDATAAADRVGPAVVSIGAGSGVVVRADGLVLTSSTLVAAGEPVEVRLPDGEPIEAQVVGVDPVTGIGVVDLPGDDHPTPELAADDPAPATTALTVGAAGEGDDPPATSGVVGGSRKLAGVSGGRGSGGGSTVLDGVIEVEGEADRRALGGPVLDDDGSVAGITTALDGEGSSYLTPIDVANKVARDLLEAGEVRHSWLGIEGRDPSDGSGLYRAGGPGAEIVAVAEGSPADAAGLRPGDVIVEFDGRPIERMSDLVRRLQARSPGDAVEVTVERGDAPATATPVLGQRPAR